ncbi:hypothetical protein HK104_010220, partial [Borealophlyctis nickersoniae]
MTSDMLVNDENAGRVVKRKGGEGEEEQVPVRRSTRMRKCRVMLVESEGEDEVVTPKRTRRRAPPLRITKRSSSTSTSSSTHTESPYPTPTSPTFHTEDDEKVEEGRSSTTTTVWSEEEEDWMSFGVMFFYMYLDERGDEQMERIQLAHLTVTPFDNTRLISANAIEYEGFKKFHELFEEVGW